MLTITIEDCMQMMKRYEDKHFDLAIVDPPYKTGAGVLDKCAPYRTKFSYKYFKKPGKKYFEELKRVSKNQIVWGGNYFTNYLRPSVCWLCWDKMEGGYNFSKFELAWTSFDSVCEMFVYNNHGGFVARGINKKIHPTQKPVALYKWILKKYAKPKYKILDTHVGSGSIAIACEEAGLELTACDIDPDVIEKTNERLELYRQQIRITLPPAIQEKLI